MRFVNFARALLLATAALFAVGCAVDELETEEVDEQSDELGLDDAEVTPRQRPHVQSVEFADEGEAAPFSLPGDQRMEPVPTPWDPGIKPPPDSEPSPGHDTVSPAPT
jgi:hypothetical protein